ncbi:hypothetical protein [Deinococcus radiophilus]|uniref:hypothetical protein n=1 Tax=Deinococcus radiophilus TaxID=32062 RepID=UPI0036134A5D
MLVGDLSGVLHRVSQMGAAMGSQDLGERIDTPITVADDGTWLVTADGQLRAYRSPWPQAAGPWSSFRGVPQGWGRSLTAAEQAPWLAARRALAGPQELALTGGATPPTTSPVPPSADLVALQPTPTAPVTSPPLVAAPDGAALPLRLVNRRVHVPLADLAQRFGGTVIGTEGGQVSLNMAEQSWTLPVTDVNGVSYVSIVELGRVLGARVTPAADSLTVEWQGATQVWPLDWITLYAHPVQVAPASAPAAVERPSPAQTP